MRHARGFALAAAALLAAPRLALPIRSQSACAAWTDPHTAVVEAAPGDDLAAKVRAAGTGTTVLLAPGTYEVAAPLRFLRDDVTRRGKSGRREDVVLDGDAAPPADRAIARLRVRNVRVSDRRSRHRG